jgi:hypothetical protein
MKRILHVGFLIALGIVLALPALASAGGAISNWAAPSSWSPQGGLAAGGRTALAVSAAPLPFIPVTPCRVADTRAGSGFPAGYGPPSMTSSAGRSFVLPGRCGIPASAVAVSFNFTVWGTSSYGDFNIYPTGAAPAAVSTLNWGPGTLALANAAVIPLGTSGAITVLNESPGTVDLFFDVNGYYASTQPTATTFYITTPDIYAIWGTSTHTNGYGVLGFGGSSGVGTYGTGGIYGVEGTSGTGIGVYGSSSTTDGVYGVSNGGNGVHGQTSVAGIAGVYGGNTSNSNGSHGVGGYASGTGIVFGVQGQISASAAAGSAGVHGIGASAVGNSYAILGETSDTTGNSAAILGRITGGGAMTPDPSTLGSWVPAGVRGEGANTGIWGFGNVLGIVGRAYTTGGVFSGGGYIGYNGGSTTYGVYGNPGSSGTTNWAVYAAGNMGASGTKPFVEPHPSQPGMVIRYVALEGPEAGTYFRGRGRFVGHQAVIEVPEDFRLVSDAEGLSIQVTPIGDLSQVAVVYLGLDSIELKSSRDVEFFYHVNGVRRTFKDWKVLVQSDEFMPEGASARMPEGLSPEQRRSLIRNGTYNEDGTVNMTTARRLGWDAQWSRRPSMDSGKAAPQK